MAVPLTIITLHNHYLAITLHKQMFLKTTPRALTALILQSTIPQ